jgi:hypothetical protein
MMGVSQPCFSKPAPWAVAKRNRRICANCGKRFKPIDPGHQYCSKQCVWLARRRPCPDDFEAVFVEIGRMACEEWYGAHTRSITRWLEECGKDRLIEARKTHVRQRPGFDAARPALHGGGQSAVSSRR